MPDARADLPADERILIRRVVADQQNCSGLVELLHRERRIGGAISKRGDKPGVIRGAMVIDVVGAKARARQPLKQVIFLVRGAVGADETDGFGAVSSVQLFELLGSGLRGLFPRNGIELFSLAQKRLLDALRMLGEIKAEAPFHAEKVPVDAGKVAIVGAEDFVVTDAEGGLAAIGAMRADRGNILHFPGPRFVTVRSASQRADGADVNAHAALYAVQVIAAIGNDD